MLEALLKRGSLHHYQVLVCEQHVFHARHRQVAHQMLCPVLARLKSPVHTRVRSGAPVRVRSHERVCVQETATKWVGGGRANDRRRREEESESEQTGGLRAGKKTA